MLLRDIMRETTDRLVRAGLGEAAAREARWLCEGALGLSRVQLLRQAARELTAAEAERIRSWGARRAAGEPIQYILGDVEFCGLRIEVGPGVLIPRPETEGLAELALAALPAAAPGGALPGAEASAAVLDLCTGSGCVALAIAHGLAARHPRGIVHAVDLSPEALRYARRNQAALGVANVRFYEGDLYAPLPPALRFAVITANPPYIPPAEYDRLPSEVRAYEPELALRAAEEGLAVFRRIVEGARERLLPGGRLFCELGREQGDAARALLARHGFAETAMLPDCFGQPRFATGRLVSYCQTAKRD